MVSWLRRNRDRNHDDVAASFAQGEPCSLGVDGKGLDRLFARNRRAHRFALDEIPDAHCAIVHNRGQPLPGRIKSGIGQRPAPQRQPGDGVARGGVKPCPALSQGNAQQALAGGG